ncbi:MAG TPA: hypothetical protein VF581_05615 [Flavobacterium sp.]|jgi:putative chitinase
MRQEFKFYQLLILSLSLLAMCGCQEDLYELETATAGRTKMERVSADHLLRNHKVAAKLHEFAELKNNYASREIRSDTILDFTIVENSGVFIEKDGLHSYIFPIEREESDGKVENIVFALNGEEYKTYIVRYDYTKQESMELSKEEIAQRDVQRYAIDLEADGRGFVKLVFICLEMGSWVDDGELYGYGNVHYVWVVTGQVCFWSTNSGQTNPSSPDTPPPFYPPNNQGGNGNPPSSDDEPTIPVIIAPVFDVSDPDPVPITYDCNTSTQKLQLLFPSADTDALNVLTTIINNYGKEHGGLDSKAKLCHFLAQAGYETGGFATLNATENLNYTTAARLIQVFPSKFSLTDPNKLNPTPYLNNPQVLANVVYANANGNGNAQSGDGWLYRGRGIMQLTWKANYNAYKNYLDQVNLASDYMGPESVQANQFHAVMSGLWFFKQRVLSKIQTNATTPSSKLTKLINRYTDQNSINGRNNIFNSAMQIIECE